MHIVFYVFLIFHLATAQQQCTAEIYLNSYYVGNGPRFNYIYHDIMVNNTGQCPITSVFVSVELPPPSQNTPSSFISAVQFNYTTGELQGFGGNIPVYEMKQGGRIVWDARDIRAPAVTLSSLRCSCSSSTSSPTSSSTSSSTPSPTPSPATSTSSHTTSTSSSPAPRTPTIILAQHPSSNAWWFALAVQNASQVVTNIEIKDSSSGSSFFSMTYNSWGYWTYSPSKEMILPITVRLTPAVGSPLTINNIISSFASTVDSHAQFTSSSSTRSVRVVNSVTASTNTIHARVHEGSTKWWLGLEISGNSEPIQSISVKDTQMITNYQTMENTTWQYTVRQSIFTPISSPFYVHIQSVSGKSVEFPVTSLTVGRDIDSGTQF